MPEHLPEPQPSTEYTPNVAVRGSGNGKTKLTVDEVRAIRQFARAGVARKAIAQQFGVSVEAISHITSRRNWNWLPDEDDTPQPAEPQTEPAWLADERRYRAWCDEHGLRPSDPETAWRYDHDQGR